MLPQDAFGRKKHDLKTGRGPGTLHPVSRFAVEQASVDSDVLSPPSSKTTRRTRITTGPSLSDNSSPHIWSSRVSGCADHCWCFIAQNSDPAAKSVHSGRMSNKEGPAASKHQTQTHIAETSRWRRNGQVSAAATTFSHQTHQIFFSLSITSEMCQSESGCG